MQCNYDAIDYWIWTSFQRIQNYQETTTHETKQIAKTAIKRTCSEFKKHNHSKMQNSFNRAKPRTEYLIYLVN